MWTCTLPTRTWKIHSTFKAGHTVNWIDVRNGMQYFRFVDRTLTVPDTMVLGGERLSLWHLDSTRSLPEWSKTWEYDFDSDTSRCTISPCGNLMASSQDGSQVLQVWRILPNTAVASSSKPFAPALVSEIFHPDAVASFEWKPDPIPAKSVMCPDDLTNLISV